MIKIENVEVMGWEHAIRGFPEYRVTRNGDVIGKRGKILKGHIDRCGYKEVMLSYYPNQKQMLVHRLVLSTFKPVPNMDKLDVNHIDGNKLNNNIENLEWCTRSENIKHAYKTGLEKKVTGEKHHNHKLTEEDVRYIRECDISSYRLAKELGVDSSTIRDIRRRKTWRNVK